MLSVIVFVSCADVEAVNDCLSSHTYGFWSGIWHGMTCPLSWIGSLIYDDISIYAVNNSGGWYDLGFVIGIGGLSGTAVNSKK